MPGSDSVLALKPLDLQSTPPPKCHTACEHAAPCSGGTALVLGSDAGKAKGWPHLAATLPDLQTSASDMP